MRYLDFAYLKKVVVATIGFTVLLIGIALIFLPGPAIVVIPIGLLILAGEFVWARRLLRRFKKEVKSVGKQIKRKILTDNFLNISYIIIFF